MCRNYAAVRPDDVCHGAPSALYDRLRQLEERGGGDSMRLGVRQKLAAAILAASVAATAATGIGTQFGFRRSFLDYLNEQGAQRLDVLVPKVAALYERDTGWDGLRRNARAWFQVMGIPGGPGPSAPTDIPAGYIRFSPDAVDTTGLALRISLADAAHRFLIGYPKVSKDAPVRAVVVDGQTVGWLYFVPLTQVSNAAERNFQHRQLILTWLIGSGVIIAGAAIAVALSHAFLDPIQSIAQAARRLAAGDFKVRVRPTSHDEIGQLGADFNQLAQSLERTEHLRRNLMADISHEFRTPLAVLRAELEAIEDGVRSLSPGSIRSLLAEVDTLNKLVGDVHDLAVADLGALSYRRANVNLAEILRTCTAAFHSRFRRAGLDVESSILARDLIVFADEGRLQQLFNNLLENSARHTDAGGRVRIEADAVDTCARVVIEDSAPGVPPEMLPRLFERFFRVDPSRSRSTGGSGLGMAICRGIVEAHGGRIAATPSELGGLRIELLLPLVIAEAVP